MIADDVGGPGCFGVAKTCWKPWSALWNVWLLFYHHGMINPATVGCSSVLLDLSTLLALWLALSGNSRTFINIVGPVNTSWLVSWLICHLGLLDTGTAECSLELVALSTHLLDTKKCTYFGSAWDFVDIARPSITSDWLWDISVHLLLSGVGNSGLVTIHPASHPTSGPAVAGCSSLLDKTSVQLKDLQEPVTAGLSGHSSMLEDCSTPLSGSGAC